MAVYFTLAIDCGRSLSAVSNIAAAFRDFSISVPNVPLVECEVDEYERENFRVVVIWAKGLGYACRDFRGDILNRGSLFLIRDTLLNHLKTLSEFRAALFGADAEDWIEPGDSTTFEESIYPGYIFSEAVLQPGSSMMNQPIFSQGYRWIPDPEGTHVAYLP